MISAAQLRILINAVDNASPVLGGIAGKADALGNKLGTAIRRGAMVGGAAMAGFAVASVKAAGDFDAAMTQSIAIMGDVSDAMRKDMSDAAREVAKVTTYSAKEVADAYYFLASAGMNAQQSMEALPQVAQFAQAGMFDLAKATDLLTDAQSALGLTSEDTAENMVNMTRVGDVLVKMNQKANASVEQFATALTQKGASALKGATKSLEEGAGMLAYWADQGLKGEQAGNALAGVLLMLPKIAKTNTDAFATYGVEIFDASGKMKTFAEIAEEFVPILENMTDAQRAQAFEQMGINRLLADSILKMKGGSEAIREYTEAAYEAAGATQEVAEKQLRTFNAQLKLLQSALNDVMIEIGNELLPKLMALVTTIREKLIPAFKEWWQQHLPAIRREFEAFGEGLRIVSDALISFGRWILDNQGRLVAAIVAIGLAFAWTNPLLAVLVGATGLVWALGLVAEETYGLKYPMNEAERAAQGLEVSFLKLSLSVLEVIHTVQLFSPLLALLGPAGAAAAVALIISFDEVGEAIGSTKRRLGELQGGVNAFDAAPLVGQLGEVVGWAHDAAGALGRIPIYSGKPVAPEIGEVRIPILDPWAERFIAQAKNTGQAAGDALGAGLETSLSDGGAAAAEEAIADLGQRLSATFTEELVAGLEGVPPAIMAMVSEAGEAIEAFSASFRPAIQEVFIDINELAVLGPDVPASYLAAQGAMERLANQVGYAAGVLAVQRSELDMLGVELWEAQFVYDDLAAAVTRYSDELGAAQDALRRFAGAQIEGTQAFKDAMFAIEQVIREKQLEILMAKMAGASEEALAALRAELEKLRDEAQKLQLEQDINFKPMEKQIEDLLSDTEELTFAEIIQGIIDAKGSIEDIEPKLAALEDLLAEQKKKVDEAGAAYDAQQDVISKTEELYGTLAGALETLERTLVSETQAALDQYAKLIYGTEVVKVILRTLEDEILYGLQPSLNSIDTSGAQGQFYALADAANAAKSAMAGLTGGQSGGASVPGYQSGGIVPGPLGAAQLAVVHGGERISPSGGEPGAGRQTINIYGRYNVNLPNVRDHRAFLREQDRMFRRM